MIGVLHLSDLIGWRAPWAKPALTTFTDTDATVRRGHPPAVVIVVCAEGQAAALEEHVFWLSAAHEVIVVGEPAVHDVARLHHFRVAADLDAAIHEARSLDRADPPDLAVRRRPAFVTPRQGPWIALDKAWDHRRIASAVCVRDGAPSLFDHERGAFIDLLSGAVSVVTEPMQTTRCAVDLDGSRVLSIHHDRETRRSWFTLVPLTSGETKRIPCVGYRDPIGFDPFGRYAFAGGRSIFDWLVDRGDAVGSIGSAEHDWPCGHAKKQYGYRDNEPLWVHVAESDDFYLSVYEKDAIVCTSVPLPWRATTAGVHRLVLTTHPKRVLYFAREEDGFPAEPDDEDARDSVPAIVLGSKCYVVDLSRETYRIRPDGEPERVNGTGYSVFDTEHRVVRSGQGRVLAGWGATMVVLADGVLYRETISTGARDRIGPEAETIEHAVPVAGQTSVILVRGDGAFVRAI